MFANNAEDLVALYSVDTATRRSEIRHSKTYIHAGILFHMRRDLETGDIYDKTLQRRFQKDFQKKFNITIPPYGITTVVKGDLGPFVKYGEHQLEPYSRVCDLVRSLQHVITPSKWDDIFIKKKDTVFFPNVSIGQDAVPSWMREIDTTQSHIAGGLIPTHSEKPNTPSEALIYSESTPHSQSRGSHMSNKHSLFLYNPRLSVSISPAGPITALSPLTSPSSPNNTHQTTLTQSEYIQHASHLPPG